MNVWQSALLYLIIILKIISVYYFVRLTFFQMLRQVKENVLVYALMDYLVTQFQGDVKVAVPKDIGLKI